LDNSHTVKILEIVACDQRLEVLQNSPAVVTPLFLLGNWAIALGHRLASLLKNAEPARDEHQPTRTKYVRRTIPEQGWWDFASMTVGTVFDNPQLDGRARAPIRGKARNARLGGGIESPLALEKFPSLAIDFVPGLVPDLDPVAGATGAIGIDAALREDPLEAHPVGSTQ
jgi:hypothetical protein